MKRAAQSRKLIIDTNRPDVRVVIVRASDTPTYVQYGAADLGIAGKDVLLEHGGAGLYQPLDLEIAQCRLCVAVPKGFDYEAGRVAAECARLLAPGGVWACISLSPPETVLPLLKRDEWSSLSAEPLGAIHIFTACRR